jgi:SAM-dependent methyltransferase
MIVEPLPPSRDRLSVFSNSNYTYFRSLQFEIINSLKLAGRVFDLGGGSHAIYAQNLGQDCVVEGLNLDPRTGPTYLHDANTPFPVASATYDMAISFNTFEHIEDDAFALGEFLRVLKPGGAFHIVVPFLYRVHGSPSDYNRRTVFWWENAFIKRGVPTDHVKIRPVAWGRLTCAFSFLEQTRLKFLRRLILRLDMLIPGARDDVRDYPMGYYISGTKPEA